MNSFENRTEGVNPSNGLQELQRCEALGGMKIIAETEAFNRLFERFLKTRQKDLVLHLIINEEGVFIETQEFENRKFVIASPASFREYHVEEEFSCFLPLVAVKDMIEENKKADYVLLLVNYTSETDDEPTLWMIRPDMWAWTAPRMGEIGRASCRERV